MLARHRLFQHPFPSLFLIILGITVGLTNGGLLGGSIIALLIVVCSQVLLPGYLLTRLLRLGRHEHSLFQFTLWLVHGFGFSITSGWLGRVLQIPMPAYIVIFFAVLLFLTLLTRSSHTRPDTEGADPAPTSAPWFTYGVLAISIAIIFAVTSVMAAFRLHTFEDQTLLAQMVEWFSSTSTRPPLDTRVVGMPEHPYVGSDGLSYTLASWTFSSGILPEVFSWHILSPLVTWIVPFLAFVTTARLTKSFTAGAYAALVLLIYALITIDGVIFRGGSFTFGYDAVFQANTLRMFSIVVLAPLVVYALLSFFITRQRAYLLSLLLLMIASVTTHPRTSLTLSIALAFITAVWMLADLRNRWRLGAGALAIVAMFAVVPFSQYNIAARLVQFFQPAPEAQLVPDEQPLLRAEIETPQPVDIELMEIDLPILGKSTLYRPSAVFIHPFTLIAVVLSLLSILKLRRSLAAQYAFGTSLALLIIAFLPPLPDLLLRTIGSYYYKRLTLGLLLLLPVPLVCAVVITWGMDRFAAFRRRHIAGLGILLVVTIVLLVDMPDIPFGPHDQLTGIVTLQELRDIQAFDEVLLSEIKSNISSATSEPAVWLAPERIASFLIESIPNALIVGGRSMDNASFPGASRFYDETYPWLDDEDLNFIEEYRVRYIIVEDKDTRLPQLEIQPERFRLVARVAGYAVFEVNTTSIQPTLLDRRFGEMNRRYALQVSPRFDAGMFQLARAGNPESWEALVALWEAELTPTAWQSYLGLAWTALLSGDDERAITAWERLQQAYPDVWLWTEALAVTFRERGSSDRALAILRGALEDESVMHRVEAANILLTERFFYLVNDELLSEILNITSDAELEWHHVAQYDQPDSSRRRISLFLSRNLLDHARGELQDIPRALWIPQDFQLMALLTLRDGKPEEALRALASALPNDQTYVNTVIHPDRWAINPVPELYNQVQSDLALRSQSQPLEPDSPLHIQESQQLLVIAPHVQRTEQGLVASATVVSPHTRGYPIRELRVAIANTETYEVYDEIIVPIASDSFLSPIQVELALPSSFDPDQTPIVTIFQPRYNVSIPYPSAFAFLN